MQGAWNKEQLVESGCDDDVVAAANNDIEDSEDFDYFYDWLMQYCKEAVTANKKLPNLFVRFTNIETVNGNVTSYRCFVHQDSGYWTWNVKDDKGTFYRAKSRTCEHSFTQGVTAADNREKI